MTQAEHINYYESLKGEPEDTTVSPLDDFARIEQRFTTPMMEMDTLLPDQMRKDLCDVLIQKEQTLTSLKESNPDFYEMAEGKGFYATTHYNLFDNPAEFPEQEESILGYEKIACQKIRYFIRKGWGVRQADDLELEGRCFGNVQTGNGSRTFPHYHQDINGVLVEYLLLGDDTADHKTKIQVGMDQSARHPSHQLIFIDPRPSINYPYWEKVYTVTPRVGLSIVHPNYLVHESNPWLGEGLRICIVVNFRIKSHGYNELIKPLRG